LVIPLVPLGVLHGYLHCILVATSVCVRKTILKCCLFVCSYPCLFPVEQKDQKTLEKLRAERKAKIDELKERTNYYLTQQLIQVSGQIAITQST
jgi:hypothetical protein